MAVPTAETGDLLGFYAESGHLAATGRAASREWQWKPQSVVGDETEDKSME